MHIHQACVQILESKHASWVRRTTFQQQTVNHNKPHMEMAKHLWSLLMQVRGNDMLKLNGTKMKVFIQSNYVVHIVITLSRFKNQM
jgi:hypothetical protein